MLPDAKETVWTQFKNFLRTGAEQVKAFHLVAEVIVGQPSMA
jgi:hypothetical protein